MNDNKKLNSEGNVSKAPKADAQALDLDALGMVNGGVGDNPFEDMPRVPAKDVDERLRVAGR